MSDTETTQLPMPGFEIDDSVYPVELFLGSDRQKATMKNLIDCYDPGSRNGWIVEQWRFANLCRAVRDAALCYCLDASEGFERYDNGSPCLLTRALRQPRGE